MNTLIVAVAQNSFLPHPVGGGDHLALTPPTGQSEPGRAGDRVPGRHGRADQVGRGHPHRPPTLCRRPVDQAAVPPPGRQQVPFRPHRIGVTVALLVMIYRRWLGTVLLAAAIVLETARMAAHVHYGQDIFAGMLIAVVAVGIASAAWRWVGPRMPQRLAEPNSAAQKASAPNHEGTT